MRVFQFRNRCGSVTGTVEPAKVWNRVGTGSRGGTGTGKTLEFPHHWIDETLVRDLGLVRSLLWLFRTSNFDIFKLSFGDWFSKNWSINFYWKLIDCGSIKINFKNIFSSFQIIEKWHEQLSLEIGVDELIISKASLTQLLQGLRVRFLIFRLEIFFFVFSFLFCQRRAVVVVKWQPNIYKTLSQQFHNKI